MGLARLWRPKTVSAFHPLRGEPDTLPLLMALADEGLLDRPAGGHRPRGAACLSPLAAGGGKSRRSHVDS